MLTPERKAETGLVKKALRTAGYRVKSVRRGTGTARCWIDIQLDMNWPEINTIRGEVEHLAAQTIHRETWEQNCILVH